MVGYTAIATYSSQLGWTVAGYIRADEGLDGPIVRWTK